MLKTSNRGERHVAHPSDGQPVALPPGVVRTMGGPRARVPHAAEDQGDGEPRATAVVQREPARLGEVCHHQVDRGCARSIPLGQAGLAPLVGPSGRRGTT